MIHRIVKLTFHQEHIGAFEQIFKESAPKIKLMPGCKGVSLLQDTNNPAIFFTYSYWNSAADLEHYRHSALFNATWAKTKVLFADKPEAWSTMVVG